jgi:hypothetical protein
MTKLFRWSSLGDRRVFGWLSEVEDMLGEIPKANTSAPTSSCTLTLFTYVADVKMLAPRFGFVAQKYDTRTNHPICDIHLTTDNGAGHAAILLDSWTSSFDLQGLENQDRFKLVCIGQGRRIQPSGEQVGLERVALLIEQKGDYSERVGLTTIPTNLFEGRLQWISIL